MNRLLLALSCVALVVSTGCYNLIDGGPEASETRSVDSFDSLRVDDGLRVKFIKGSPQVTIDAPQKVFQYLDTTVKSGRLVVSLRNGVAVTSQDTISITVSGDGVSTFEATGASHITADELSASPLRITASGASLVTLSGSSADFRVSASGGSTISAAKVVAEDVSVELSGGSTAEVQATKSITGSASGGSKVTVTGGADGSRVSVSGGSTVN
ncbi:MAG: DUF2807 domain-containing protein [Myxococcaceae bacterium]